MQKKVILSLLLPLLFSLLSKVEATNDYLDINIVKEEKIHQDNKNLTIFNQKTITIISSEDIKTKKEEIINYLEELNLTTKEKDEYKEKINNLSDLSQLKYLKEEVTKISEENTKKEKEEKSKTEEKDISSSENIKTSKVDYSNYSSSVVLPNGNTPGEIGAYAAKRLEALTGESAKTWEYIIARESNGNPEARNPSGAYGLLQLMPMHGNPKTVDEQIEIGANLYHKAKAYFGNGLQPWGM